MSKLFLFFCFLCVTPFSIVEAKSALILEEVLNSSMKYYPQVLESIYNLEESENRYKLSKGEGFDAKLKANFDKRFEGFYDGESLNVQIEKPISFLNSELYGGIRQSDGSFPSYETKAVVTDGTEAFAGISLSLLRNSLIDLRRYKVRLAREDLKQSSFELDQVRIKVQTSAIKAYWTWVIKARELDVYNEILDLAKVRQDNIKKRVKAGDLARIFKAENELYINERIANLRKSEIDFRVASFYLSLFYRDSEGRPIDIDKNWVGNFKLKDLEKVTFSKGLVDIARSKNLKIKTLVSKKRQAMQELKLGRNSMLPKLDLNVEVGQDSAIGTRNLQETRAILNFELPLQFNSGLGKKRAARSKFESLKIQEKLQNEKLEVHLKSILFKINNSKDIIDLTDKQVELSKRLVKAERRKFTQGSSDLILLNLREEKLAESRVKNLSAFLTYQNFRAELKEVLVDFITPL